MVRGWLQVEWLCPDQTRANTQRDWLNLQLSGRGFIAQDLPRATLKRGDWVTVADVAFDTVAEGNVVKTLAASRQAADPFILPGSWHQIHTCLHEQGVGDCRATVVRTVK